MSHEEFHIYIYIYIYFMNVDDEMTPKMMHSGTT